MQSAATLSAYTKPSSQSRTRTTCFARNCHCQSLLALGIRSATSVMIAILPPTREPIPGHMNSRSPSTWRTAARLITITLVLASGHIATAQTAGQQVANDKSAAEATGMASELLRLYLGNELWRFGVLALATFVGFLGGRIARAMLHSSAKRLEAKGRRALAAVCDALRKGAAFLCLVAGIYVGISFLQLPAEAQPLVRTVLAILFSLSVAWMAYSLVDVVEVVLTRIASRTPSKLDDMLVPMVRASLRVTVVVLTIVQLATIVSNKPLTSVIAGLGVGGLAIGLAAQDMIKNFFGSMMIFSDRPFELGDRIVVDGFDGPVESVGFRSTRIRTLDGHLVTIPNGELANKSIRNVSKRAHIKRAFEVGVTYDTAAHRIEEAIGIVHEILDNHEGMDADYPPRVYFTQFEDSALVIQIIYWYHPADYWKYCEFNERTNLEILRRFNSAGIEFAFPTRTVHLISPTATSPVQPAQSA